MPKLSRGARAQMAEASKNYFDSAREHIKTLVEFDIMPSLEEAREQAIKSLLDSLKGLSLREELVETQNEIKRKHLISYKKISKTQKQLLAREKELLTQLKELDKSNLDILKTDVDASGNKTITLNIKNMTHNIKDINRKLSNLIASLEGTISETASAATSINDLAPSPTKRREIMTDSQNAIFASIMAPDSGSSDSKKVAEHKLSIRA